jgi:hypothetical protein
MEITTESCDYLGNKWDPETVRTQIHNMKINNVYKDYFEGNMPFPNAKWLEMSYINYENSKIFDNNLKQKALFKKHDSIF